jgi:biopolymer transport protein ExbD
VARYECGSGPERSWGQKSLRVTFSLEVAMSLWCSSSKTPICGIQASALIDISIVLIVVLSIMSYPSGHGPDVRLPETSNPPAFQEGIGSVSLLLMYNGNTFVGANWISDGMLESALRDAHRQSPAKPLWIRADRRIPYSEVRAAIKTARDAGFRRVTLLTSRKQPPQTDLTRPQA